MTVGASQTHRQGNALAFHQKMMLAAQLAPIHGVFAGFLAAMAGSHAGAVNHAPLPREFSFGLEFGQQALPQPLPDAPPLPFEEAAATGMTGWEIAGCRKRFPGD